MPKYEPLDLEKTYTVVMNSYMVSGGDGFAMVQEELLKHNTGGQQRWFRNCVRLCKVSIYLKLNVFFANKLNVLSLMYEDFQKDDFV